MLHRLLQHKTIFVRNNYSLKFVKIKIHDVVVVGLHKTKRIFRHHVQCMGTPDVNEVVTRILNTESAACTNGLFQR